MGECPICHGPCQEHDRTDNSGLGSGIWECYGCGARRQSLDEGWSTRCALCGSYELHLSDAAKENLR